MAGRARTGAPDAPAAGVARAVNEVGRARSITAPRRAVSFPLSRLSEASFVNVTTPIGSAANRRRPFPPVRLLSRRPSAGAGRETKQKTSRRGLRFFLQL